MAWVLDLDGVVWLGPSRSPARSAAVGCCARPASRWCSSPTTRSPTPGQVADELGRFGIDPRRPGGDLGHGGGQRWSSRASGCWCAGAGRGRGAGRPGRRGGRPQRRRGRAVDAVVVGLHRDFDYERLRVAAAAVRRGARLLATNDDATYPTPDGAAARRRSHPGRGRRRLGRAGGGGGQAPRADGRASCRVWPARAAWWSGTDPTPTGASPGRWATASPSC